MADEAPLSPPPCPQDAMPHRPARPGSNRNNAVPPPPEPAPTTPSHTDTHEAALTSAEWAKEAHDRVLSVEQKVAAQGEFVSEQLAAVRKGQEHLADGLLEALAMLRVERDERNKLTDSLALLAKGQARAQESLDALRHMADEIPPIHGRVKDLELAVRVLNATERQQSEHEIEQEVRLRQHSIKLRAFSKGQLAGGAGGAAILGAVLAEVIKRLLGH